MKKIILFSAGLILAASLFAQTPPADSKAAPAKPAPAQNAAPAKAAPAAKYCCAECDYTSDKPGDCPMHKKALIKEGTYYCPDCHTTAEKAGKCPKCGKDMVKMVEKKKGEMKKEETPILSNPPTKTPATEPVVIFQGSFRPIQQAVQGEARIIKQGTKTTLKLSPFRISNGPKLHVYLSKHPNPSRKEEIGESYVDLGALQTYFGFQEYTIPADIDLTKYHAAVIYSEAYGALYATAPLTKT